MILAPNKEETFDSNSDAPDEPAWEEAGTGAKYLDYEWLMWGMGMLLVRLGVVLVFWASKLLVSAWGFWVSWPKIELSREVALEVAADISDGPKPTF